MAFRRIVRADSLSKASGVDRDILKRTDRAAYGHGGKCRMYSRNPVWLEATHAFDFSTTTSSVDLTSSLPQVDFVVLPHAFFVISTDWFYYVSAVTRDVTLKVGMFNGATFKTLVQGTLIDANFTGGGSPYHYDPTAQRTFGMQLAERSTDIYGDSAGPANKEDTGAVGAVFRGLGGTDFTKFQLTATTTHANRKTGTVTIYIPIDILESSG
jgi:hypothetical protein